MRKFLLAFAGLALLGAGCQPYSTPGAAPAPAPTPAATAPSAAMPIKGAPAPQPATTKVNITDSAFSPQQLAIKPGDTVVWTNTGKSNHTVTGLNAVLVWDSGNLKPGQQYKRTFDQPGVYDYHDNLNAKMTGEIIVGQVQPQNY